MTRTHRRLLGLLIPFLAVTLVAGACGDDDDEATPSENTEQPADDEDAVATGPDTAAAALRSDLNALLQEHVLLASAATNAALGGRADEFMAATAALEGNTDSLTATVGAVFGAETGDAFEALWTEHIGHAVGYAEGLAAGSGARQGEARAGLTAFATNFGSFVNESLPELPAEEATELADTHVQTFLAVVDAQAGGDQAQAFTALREAAAQAGTVADPLVAAIAQAMPGKVSGDPDSPATTLLTSLNTTLREHVYLATLATNGALGGRNEEFRAAADALDANSEALTALMGSVYGNETGAAFNSSWNTHIGFLVDYTTGLAGNDKAKQDQAVQDLLSYAGDFGAFLNSATPDLPAETAADLIETHVLTVKDVVDAQAAGDFPTAYQALRTAADHMKMIANPLALALTDQFPEKF